MFFLVVSAKGQAPSNYYNRMQQVFGAIDKNKVSTGLFKEFGIRFNEVEAYNGTLGTTNYADKTQWQSLYNSLHSMRVGTVATMTEPDLVFANLDNQQKANPSIIMLTALHYQYQQYKANAYTNGDVTVTNERIYDVAGRNPYEIKYAFAVAPLKHYLKGNSFIFRLPSNMIYANTGKTLTEVAIDFGNGLGYQNIYIGNDHGVTYSSGGEKIMKVRFSYSDGTIINSHSKLYVDYVAPAAVARYAGGNREVTITATKAYQGILGVGNITIEYAGTDGILDKPLIVVEGFDPLNDFHYRQFINNPSSGGINIPIDLDFPGQTLNDAVEAAGYDLVFVDYANGTDFIQRNAFMVEEVIAWVNRNKTGTQKNVILGMSMGGLVARYALRDMEVNGLTHNVKLYISHDSPHQGANVPLAAQAMARHLYGETFTLPVFLSIFDVRIKKLRDLVPGLGEALNLLQSPAAQQMLIYQLSGEGASTPVNNSPHASFTTEYKNLGFPTQGGIRNIAISNGSECGTPLNFAPYAQLISVNETIDLPLAINVVLFWVNTLSANPTKIITSFLSTNTDVKMDFDLRALPDKQALRVYKGSLYIKKKVLFLINIEEPLIAEKSTYSTPDMLPLDNAAGGIYDVNDFATLPATFTPYILQQRFNFVPTYSSLDIGSSSQTIVTADLSRVYSPLLPPVSPKNTAFHNFFTNPTTSERHIQFTQDNGRWLLSELKGIAASYSCANSCASQSPMSISGPPTACQANTSYSVNLPAGASITWTTSANLTRLSAQGANPLVVQSNGSGSAWIDATVNYQCGSKVLTRLNIITGALSAPSIIGPTSVCPNSGGYYQANVSGTVTNYIWGYSGLTYYNGGWNTITLSAPSTFNGGHVQLSVQNNCGTSPTVYLSVGRSYSCAGYYTYYVSPNPSTDYITIKAEKEKDTNTIASSKIETTAITKKPKVEVKLYYFIDGSLAKTYPIDKEDFVIATKKFKRGKYIMHIIENDKIVVVEQLIFE